MSSRACLSLAAPSLEATHAVAAVVASVSRGGDVIVLAGELGAGKTAFAQGFGRALGITEPITSPTFTLVHSYDTPSGALHHADIYRLDQLAEVVDLSIGELSEGDGIVLVEWGDVVSGVLGEHLEVRLDVDAGDTGAEGDGEAADDEPPTRRQIRIRASGPTWAPRWNTLLDRLVELGFTVGSC